MEPTVRTRRSPIAIIVAFVIGIAAGLGATYWIHSTAFAGHAVPVYVSEKVGPHPASAASNDMGFAPLFKPALPTAVSILSSRMVKVPQNPLFNNPFFQQFFGGRFPQQPQEQREMGLGSGVIVSPDGYILTNNHVVDKATELKVMLSDKREFPGKVVGTDPKTDIAVVKIAATGLPTITLGDSSKLQVGDYAFAIGNPFGVGETATMGIVSATGRNGLDIENYEDFIQTDAAINPGNSGGALLNARGELIGINTAILSGNGGGNQGVGFAIPINMAKYVMDQILKHGKVVRGYLGAGIQEVTPAIAKAMGLDAPKGALVSDVSPNSPAQKAGLQSGDVILAVNGNPVLESNQLRMDISMMGLNQQLKLQVFRNGHTENLVAMTAPLPGK